jgi:hypothetical protein
MSGEVRSVGRGTWASTHHPTIIDLPCCAGGYQTCFRRNIEANKYHEIDLATIGIPADATVLQVGYTPQGGEGGGVFPIEVHGNVPQRRVVGNVLRVLGQPMMSSDGTVGTVCPVAIWVLWIHHEQGDGWPYLVGGFEAFIDRHYDRVIVPAQSVVEIALMPIIRELFERHASVRHVKEFMGERLTFGNVVNVLLPFICGQAEVPKLPETIRTSINKLRRLRNAVVHSGTGDNKITSQQAAECLCAAVFGLQYVRYVKPTLRAWLRA